MVKGIKKFFKGIFSWLRDYWIVVVFIISVVGCIGLEIAYFNLVDEYNHLVDEYNHLVEICEESIEIAKDWKNQYEDLKERYEDLENLYKNRYEALKNGYEIRYENLENRYENLKDEYYKELNKENDFLSELLVVKDDTYIIQQKRGDGNYYYNTLTEDEKAMYKTTYKILEEFWNGKRELTYEYVSETYYLATLLSTEYPTIDEYEGYRRVFWAINKDNPSFLWGNSSLDISPEYVIGYKKNESNQWESSLITYYTITIEKEYKNLVENKDFIETSIENSVSKLSQKINDEDTDLIKYIKIYEYVINNTKYMYDYQSEAILDEYTTSIVGVLDGANNTGSICQGYARAMNYLCNYFGVDCINVSSAKISHAFNLVCIDGIWYYSDATNGDHNYTKNVCLLGGEKEYWSWMGLEKSYANDHYYLEVPVVSQENYLIDNYTYTGSLQIY